MRLIAHSRKAIFAAYQRVYTTSVHGKRQCVAFMCIYIYYITLINCKYVYLIVNILKYMFLQRIMTASTCGACVSDWLDARTLHIILSSERGPVVAWSAAAWTNFLQVNSTIRNIFRHIKGCFFRLSANVFRITPKSAFQNRLFQR